MNQEEEAIKTLDRIRLVISRFNTILLVILDLSKKSNFSFGREQLTAWITQRTKITLKVEVEKRKLGLPIHCPDREQEELERLIKLAYWLELDLEPEEITDFFTQIFAKSRQAQEAQRRAAQAAFSP